MKNRKNLFFLLIFILIIGLFGCSGGGSSGGGGNSTPPPAAQTPTEKLVGTWNFVSSDDGLPPQGNLVYNANNTGNWGGSGFRNGRIDNGVFYFTLDSGQDEAFDITWSNNSNTITLINHNGGHSYIFNRAS